MMGAQQRPSPKRKRYVGQVVYLYAFDIAYEMKRSPVPQKILGQPLKTFHVGLDKRLPRNQIFYELQTADLPPIECTGPAGPVKVERTVKVLPVGAISISMRIKFEVEHIEELVTYHDFGWKAGSISTEVRQLAEELRRDLEPFCISPAAHLVEEEAYTVFFMEAPLKDSGGAGLSAEAWLKGHARQAAALLTEEHDVNVLSQQEVEESTATYLSYYRDDLVVIDWDAALVVATAADFEEVLYVMELANVQLAEVEAYDRLLEKALERAYRDLRRNPWRDQSHILGNLKELRIDLARLSDELSNITKFFGDWHLARVYKSLAARFHLTEWHKALDEKLKTLDDMYQILKHDQNNRIMLLMEGTIVLLFIVDLVILYLGIK